MSVEIKGINDIIDRLEGVADAAKMRKAITDACMIVERAAKINAQAVSDGIAGSIASRYSDYSGEVYTPLFYAPYVEFGTGIEAEDGKGRQDVPWVYVEHSGREGSTQKSYTQAEAEQTVAILRGKGLDAHYTYGQKPRPFMRPALDDNRERITEVLKGGLLQK